MDMGMSLVGKQFRNRYTEELITIIACINKHYICNVIFKDISYTVEFYCLFIDNSIVSKDLILIEEEIL